MSNTLRFTDAQLAAYNAKRGGKAPKTTESPAIRAVKPRKGGKTETGRAFPASGTHRPSKYRSRATGSYSSGKEARRAAVLKLRQAAGEISDLEEQVKYVLIPRQVDARGKVIEREAAYHCDFRYWENGAIVVEDVKSPATRTVDYVLRRKMMLFFHNIRVVET